MEADIPADSNPTDEIFGEEEKKESVPIDKALLGEEYPLDNSPPDFALAWKHSDAHKVKSSKLIGITKVIGDSNKDRDDEDKFCPWWKAPTSKAVPKFSLCISAKKLDNLGLGFPLYSFIFSWIFIVK